MNYKYKTAGIAGKFRLIHKAHVELILRAMGYTETLHIFIVDIPQYKRYASIDQLIVCFDTIFEHLAYANYEIHVINEALSGEAWDKRLLELVPELEAMFDSKEPYNNVLLKNEFIELDMSPDVSVTNMEKEIYKNENFWLVAEEFKPYLTKKIIITGQDELRIARLIEQVRMYYDALVLNLADISAIDQLVLCPKKLVLINETISQVQMTADDGLMTYVDHVVYLQNLLKNDENLAALPAINLSKLPLSTPEVDFSLIIKTINTLLQNDINKIEE